MQKTLDVRGDQYPISIVKAKEGLKELRHGDTLCILVDNETSMKNLMKMADQLKIKAENQKTNDGYSVEFFYRGEPLKVSDASNDDFCKINMTHGMETLEKHKKRKIVVVIDSDKMGSGNDELGGLLIKCFIYALSRSEDTPTTIIFCNGGVKFTCKESEVLSDLESLKMQGVEILTNSACLDYYKLRDKLVIGKCVDMYTIVEKELNADLVIKP